MIGPLPAWAKDMPRDIIEAAAAEYGLREEWVYAVVMKESSGKTWATRFELEAYEKHLRRYKNELRNYFVDPKGWARKIGFGYVVETEMVHQMTSWGLMQVMGFKAREMGFGGHLPEICDPRTGVRLGCRALRGFLDQYKGIYRHAVLAYNAGSVRTDPATGKFVNQGYLDQVLLYLQDLSHTGNIGT